MFERTLVVFRRLCFIETTWLLRLARWTFVLLMLISVNPAVSSALVIYDWEGTCSLGCSEDATAILMLSDSYIPGTLIIGTGLFESFQYTSSSMSYTIPLDAAIDSIFGTLPTLGPSPALITLNFEGAGTILSTDIGGGWGSAFTFPPDPTIENSGSMHSWTLRMAPVPIVQPGLLLFSGLVALELFRRKFKKS